jgi:hypothetical protein
MTRVFTIFLLILFMALLPLNLYAHTSGGSHQHPHPPDDPNDEEGGPGDDEGGPNTDDVNPNTDDDDGGPNTDDDANKDAEQDAKIEALERKIREMEAKDKTSEAVQNIKDAVGLVPVVGPALEKGVHWGSKFLPTHVCEKCGEIYHFSHECWFCDVCGEWYTDQWQGGHASCPYKCIDCGQVGSHKCYY